MRYVLTVVVGVGLAIALTATWLVWGPLTSGALLLMWPNRTPAVSHDLSDDYPLLHKGHMDPSTGVYVREDDDVGTDTYAAVRAPENLPVRQSRLETYGVGGTSNAEWYLIGDPQKLTWAELILADGGRIHFDRTSPGISFSNAMFIHRKTPTAFWGSRLGWTGWGWVLRFQDGTVTNFFGCSPTGKSNCSLIRMRDSDGHILNFPRDSDGVLSAIEAPSERISLEYDDRRRVVRAADAASHEVRYSYDDRGRLVQARDAEGTLRLYTCGARDEMLTIREPGWFIENTFDDDLRVIRQVTTIANPSFGRGTPGTYTTAFRYSVMGGSVTETNVTEYDGSHTVLRFDARHYTSVEIKDADSENPVIVSFNRAVDGEYATSLSVRCSPNGRQAVGAAQVEGNEEETKDALIRRTCSVTSMER